MPISPHALPPARPPPSSWAAPSSPSRAASQARLPATPPSPTTWRSSARSRWCARATHAPASPARPQPSPRAADPAKHNSHSPGRTHPPCIGAADTRRAGARLDLKAAACSLPYSPPARLRPQLHGDRTSRMAALERMRGRLGREGLHAHRALASPMELFARGDMRAQERVPPVRRGAADRCGSRRAGPGACRCAQDLCEVAGSCVATGAASSLAGPPQAAHDRHAAGAALRQRRGRRHSGRRRGFLHRRRHCAPGSRARRCCGAHARGQAGRRQRRGLRAGRLGRRARHAREADGGGRPGAAAAAAGGGHRSHRDRLSAGAPKCG